LETGNKKKENWFRRTFLGGLDPSWLAIVGLGAALARRRARKLADRSMLPGR
jgi:hypothetical protein